MALESESTQAIALGSTRCDPEVPLLNVATPARPGQPSRGSVGPAIPSGKQESVMAELAGPLRVMKIAIQTAKIAYPDYERESGTKWPDKHLDPAEAQLFAFAALRALDGAGFDIVPKKDKPDADRP